MNKIEICYQIIEIESTNLKIREEFNPDKIEWFDDILRKAKTPEEIEEAKRRIEDHKNYYRNIKKTNIDLCKKNIEFNTELINEFEHE